MIFSSNKNPLTLRHRFKRVDRRFSISAREKEWFFDDLKLYEPLVISKHLHFQFVY